MGVKTWRGEVCGDCGGDGEVEKAPFWSDEWDIIDCPTCQGRGRVCDCGEAFEWCECPEEKVSQRH